MATNEVRVEPIYSQSYSGSAIKFIDHESVLIPMGRVLSVTQLGPTMEDQSFLWAQDNSNIDAFAACPRKSFIAYSCAIVNPIIRILNFPNFEMKQELMGGADLGYSQIEFSRDSQRLVAIGKEREPRLFIWQWEKNQKLMDMRLPTACSFVSFNPANRDQIVTGGIKGIYFWHMNKILEEYSLQLKKGATCAALIENSTNNENVSERDLSVGDSFVSHCWGTGNKVYASNRSGKILVFFAETGEILNQISPVSDNLDWIGTSIILTLTHLICGGNDGALRWINLSNFSIQRIFQTDQALKAPITHVVNAPMFDKLLCGTESCKIYETSCEIIEDDAANKELMKVDEVRNYNSGKTLAIKSVVMPGCFTVTASEDGSVKLWNHENALPELTEYCILDSKDGSKKRMPVTALTTFEKDPVVLVGSAGGTLTMLYVYEDPKQNSLEFIMIKKLKLFTGPVTALYVDSQDNYLAAVSSRDKRLYILKVFPEGSFDPIGFWDFDDTITSVFWVKQMLNIVTENNVLFCIDPSKAKNDTDSAMIEPQKPMWCQNLKYPVLSATSKGHNFFTVHPDLKRVCSYTHPMDQNIAAGGTLNPTVEYEFERPMTTATTSPNGEYLVTGTLDGAIVIWSIADGGVLATQDSIHVHCNKIISTCFSLDGTKLYTTSEDGVVFVSIIEGVDTIIPKMPGAGFKRIAQWAKSEKGDKLSESWKAARWIDMVDQKLAEKKSIQNEANKDVQRQLLSKLSVQLQELLNHNNECPDLEKLEREEFVINIRETEAFKNKNIKEADDLRLEIETDDMKKELIRSRIKEKCWDSVKAKVSQIKGISNDTLSAFNFGIPVLSEEEKKKVEKVKLLRTMELRDIRQKNPTGRVWNGLDAELPKDISWIINDGLLYPTSDIDAIVSRKADISSAADGKQDEKKAPVEGEEGEEQGEEQAPVGVDESSYSALLYPPTCLRTQNQKRTQIILMKALIREIKENFNAKYDKIYSKKQDVVDEICKKNERIKEILAELQSNEVIVNPTFITTELPEDILTVYPEEMESTPYETAKMREKRLQAEEERRKREEEASKDNIGERALMDMMNGTLEAKVETLDLSDLVRPDFVEYTPVEEYSEEQKAELEAFEALEKKIREDQENKRKEFELELKKLKTEVADLSKNFDDVLSELMNIRHECQSMVCTQELYIVRLAVGLINHEDAILNNRKLEIQLRELEAERSTVYDKIKNFTEHYELCRDQCNTLQEEERLMERNFKKDLQEASAAPIDQDTVKILLGLYKSRPRRSGPNQSGATSSARGSRYSTGRSSNRTSNRRQSKRKQSMDQSSRGTYRRNSTSNRLSGASSTGDMGPLQEAMIEVERKSKALAKVSKKDPFYTHEEAEAEKTRRASEMNMPEIIPLNQDLDPPEGFIVADTVWNRLQELRTMKIIKEFEIKKANTKFNEMKKQLDGLQDQLDTLDGKISDIYSQKRQIAEKTAFDERNLEILIRLKQGQTEVDQEAVVTDYTDTLLLSTEEVKKTNTEVQRLGGEKVKTLSKIKNFRKSINYIAWEHKYLSAMSRDLEEHYKDLHLLRVTRDLQDQLKDDHAEKERVKLEKAELRINIMGKAHNDKITKLKKLNSKLIRQYKEREDENGRLDDQLKYLRSSVAARESIYRTRAEGADGLNPIAQAAARMKRITMRRKLVDLARAQTEELDYLRSELDRLRRRTFPSFIHATNERHSINPDEVFA